MTTDQLIQALRRRLKASRNACLQFIDDARLVAVGLKQAYLIDCLSLPDDSLEDVLAELRQSDSNFGDTIFWTESITQQVFLLNRRILQDDSLRAIPLAFCDPVGGQVKAESDLNAARVFAALRDAAANVDKLADRGPVPARLDVNLHEYAPEDSEKAARTMIQVAGMLLEYPVVYAVSDLDAALASLSGRSLRLLKLQVKDAPFSIMQFSVPEDLLGQIPGLQQHLQRTLSLLQRRSRHREALEWSTQVVTLDHVTL